MINLSENNEVKFELQSMDWDKNLLLVSKSIEGELPLRHLILMIKKEDLLSLKETIDNAIRTESTS